jgi:hypothetical protein
MRLENIAFEQYGEKGKEINVIGRAGFAQIETDTGNLLLDRGIVIEVGTEEITLETSRLEWKDETRILSGGDYDEVYIYREDGTSFTGIGLSIDARRREWEFTGSVRGTYTYND